MKAVLQLAAVTALGALMVTCAPVAPQRSDGVRISGTAGDGRASEQAAPDFSVTSFEGEDFRLADRRGSVVVLNFFESW
jgi:cytochrome oxidase Cu insertion factor (SCO1/SenC/PrrC family)